MHRLLPTLVIVLLMTAVLSCSRVPSHVIPPKRMSEVMADLNMADAVVDKNYNDFMSDSARMLLKQSVLDNHGYTVADFDTSMVWYGAHIDKYNDVMDNTVQILEKRLESAGAEALRILSDEQGDSVNVWNGARFLIVKPTSPSQYLAYEYADTASLNRGDIFTLRASFTGMTGSPEWTISADYDDGTFEVLSSRFSGDGWHELVFYADSTRTPRRVYGSIGFDQTSGVMLVDSLQFIQRSLDAKRYSQRYRQRHYDMSSKKQHNADYEEVVE